jgi:hypothetical protein
MLRWRSATKNYVENEKVKKINPVAFRKNKSF